MAIFFPAHDSNSSIFQYTGMRHQEGYIGDFASKYSIHPQQVSPTGGHRMLHDTDFAWNFQCISNSVNVEYTVEREDGDHLISLHFHQVLMQRSNV